MTLPAQHVVVRDDAGDAIRAWAIVGVVCIHGLDLVLPAALFEGVAAYFRWAVPAFITLSAFYTASALRHKGHQGWLAFVRQRGGKLLWPFLAYSLLYLWMFADLATLTPARLLTTHFSGYGWAGQYFFVVLGQVLPVVYALSRWRVGWAALGMSLLAGGVLFAATPGLWARFSLLDHLADRPVVYWLPYVVLGVFLAQHKGRRWPAWLPRVPGGPVVQRLVGIVLILLLPLLISANLPPAGRASPYAVPIVLCVAALVVPLMLHTLRRPVPRPVAYLGSHSLVVFGLNPFFITLIRRSPWAPHLAPDGTAASVLAALALVAVVVGACLLTGALLKRMGLRSLVC